MLALATACGLGVLNGVRHALEPDHVAAVSTMIAGTPRPRVAVGFALAWGVGHGLALTALSGVLFVAGVALPERFQQGFELLAGLMLVLLGLRAWRLARAGVAKGAVVAVATEGQRVPPVPPAPPLLVGLVHGLAGTGALMALIPVGFGGGLAGTMYVALYGLGAALGMALLAALVGGPLAQLLRARPSLPRDLLRGTALASVVVGAFWVAPVAWNLFR